MGGRDPAVAAASIASWAASSAIWSTSGPRPAREPARARAASSRRASRSARRWSIRAITGATRRGEQRFTSRLELAFGHADDLERPPSPSPSPRPAAEARLGEQARRRRRAPHDGRRPRPAGDSRPRPAAGRARGRDRGPATGRGRRSGSRSSRTGTGRPPRRAGRRARGWRARRCRCRARRRGRGPARRPGRSRSGAAPRSMPASVPSRSAAGIVGMGEDDRGPRGRPQHAGRAGRPAGDRVEERALAGPGRPEQEHDQRRVEAAGANPDVAREVVAQPRGPRPGRHRTGGAVVTRRSASVSSRSTSSRRPAAGTAASAWARSSTVTGWRPATARAPSRADRCFRFRCRPRPAVLPGHLT